MGRWAPGPPLGDGRRLQGFGPLHLHPGHRAHVDDGEHSGHEVQRVGGRDEGRHVGDLLRLPGPVPLAHGDPGGEDGDDPAAPPQVQHRLGNRAPTAVGVEPDARLPDAGRDAVGEPEVGDRDEPAAHRPARPHPLHAGLEDLGVPSGPVEPDDEEDGGGQERRRLSRPGAVVQLLRPQAGVDVDVEGLVRRQPLPQAAQVQTGADDEQVARDDAAQQGDHRTGQADGRARPGADAPAAGDGKGRGSGDRGRRAAGQRGPGARAEGAQPVVGHGRSDTATGAEHGHGEVPPKDGPAVCDLTSLPRSARSADRSPWAAALSTGSRTDGDGPRRHPALPVRFASSWNCAQLSAGFRGSHSFCEVATSGIRMPSATCWVVCAFGRSPQTANRPPRICGE